MGHELGVATLFQKISGMRVRRPYRLGMAPEPMRTAKELASITGVSYRVILSAISSGELESIRPSGNGRGTIYVADSSWDRWIERKKTKTTVKGRLDKTRPVNDLALT